MGVGMDEVRWMTLVIYVYLCMYVSISRLLWSCLVDLYCILWLRMSHSPRVQWFIELSSASFYPFTTCISLTGESNLPANIDLGLFLQFACVMFWLFSPPGIECADTACFLSTLGESTVSDCDCLQMLY